MQIKIFLLFAPLALFSCNSAKKENQEVKTDSLQNNIDRTLTASPKDWIDSLLFLPDTSLIVVHKDIEKFIQLNRFTNFKSSNQSGIGKSLAVEWGLDTSFIHEYYSKLYETTDKKLRILRSGGTDNSALWLVTFDGNQRPVDKYEISGGECDGGWNDEDDRMCSCEFKMAIQLDDSTFLVRKVKECKKVEGKSEFVKLKKWIIYIGSTCNVVERGDADPAY